MPYNTRGRLGGSCTHDGVYRGTYLVSETNAVGSTGVDITGMETAYAAVNADYGSDMTTAAAENRYGRTCRHTAGLTEPADITGGYLPARSDTASSKAGRGQRL